MEQDTAFANCYSKVRVVRFKTQFDGQCLNYTLVRSICNKLVITRPLVRLANLSPSYDKSASALTCDHVITPTYYVLQCAFIRYILLMFQTWSC